MTKVFLLCSGLGNVKRGFESFTQECFENLTNDSNLDINITLFKGGGTSLEREITLPNLPRTSATARHLGHLTNRGSYFIEQATFTFSLLPHIQRQQPDIIYFSDGNVGNILWHWRRLTQQKYKLLYSNGGPLPPDFSRWDHIQQVAPIHLQLALDAGIAETKQSLIPYGIKMPSQLNILPASAKVSLREKLGLPRQRPILLSVATINNSHKRMNYLIKETASLPQPRPYLVILGQQDQESTDIIKLGKKLLGKENFAVLTVAPQTVTDYYRVADIFVLASVGEGLPRSLLEAMSHGLPCLVHDYEVTRYAVAENGYLADFTVTGSLTKLINQVLPTLKNNLLPYQRHQSTYQRFSWEQLRPKYLEMIRQVAISK